MKPITKFKILIVLLVISLNVQSIFAQSKADIFNDSTRVTWLGLDYSQARFITALPTATTLVDITNVDFAQKYIPAWNYLFMMDAKKFDVAKAMHRSSVDYSIDVADKANRALKKDFLSANPSDYKILTEQNISDLVKKYDFQGKTGIGMIFFVEGMSERTGTESVWVTFVDMNSKTLLFTAYLTDKIGGMGFRNHWADATYKILKQIEADYSKWAK